MPVISRFYGIMIRMYLIDREHPPRHIHIKYADYEAVMELENLNIIDGRIPKKCRELVREWAELHQDELIEMWDTPELSSHSTFGVSDMKLQQFEQLDGYRFKLVFENGEIRQTDLKELIGGHVAIDALCSARLDPEWGCLEFNGGLVDIEPKTLYNFSCTEQFERAA